LPALSETLASDPVPLNISAAAIKFPFPVAGIVMFVIAPALDAL
jgi:hypothetical protein